MRKESYSRSPQGWTGKTKLGLRIALSLLASLVIDCPAANAESQNGLVTAQAIFNNVTGVTKSQSDPIIIQMGQLVDAGNLTAAALVAANDDHFITITIRHLAAILKTRGENAAVPLGDFDSTFMGFARDNLDLRRILTDNIQYSYNNISPAPAANNNTHYSTADSTFSFQEGTGNSLVSNLVQGQLTAAQAPVNIPALEYAGVLVSRDWFMGTSSYQGLGVDGTNRAMFNASLRAFECVPLIQVGNDNLPGDRVRQDVDRTADNYVTKCATCHNVQDANNPWNFFASSDNNAASAFSDGQIVYKSPGSKDTQNNSLFNSTTGVASKVLRNNTVYPNGYVNIDNSWINQLGPNNPNASSLGMNFVTGGNGVHQYGELIANSTGFPACMATRMFSQMCLRKDFNPDQMTPDDYQYLTDNQATIQSLASDFSANGFNLRRLATQTAIQAQCLP